MAVFGPDWTVMTGGSANIAFTSMWFHSEMNIAFMDTARIKNWVAQLWSEHLQKVSVEEAMELIGKPQDAFNFFKDQAARNLAALEGGRMPEGRVYDWKTTSFPTREFDGIDLSALPTPGRAGSSGLHQRCNPNRKRDQTISTQPKTAFMAVPLGWVN